MKLQFCDQILSITTDEIETIKVVTSAEEYLQDHFPEFPLLPGVFQLETLVQAARKLVDTQPNAPKLPMILHQVRNIKYADMVQPGDTLRTIVRLRKREGEIFEFQAEGYNGDRLAISGRFSLTQMTQSE